MPHQSTEQFWKLFDNLPEHIKNSARRNFELLKSNPNHPSLHFKKAGMFWSVRVSKNYRALAIEEKDVLRWVWIGNHTEYQQIINS